MVKETLVGGRRVSFRHEEGEGPALVCMHGAGGNRHVYDRLFDALSGSECFAVDRPGRLGSEGPALAAFSDQVAFMRSFVASEVPTADYVLVGHSLGGALALDIAIDHPSARLKGIVLLATGARLKVHPGILAVFEQLASTGARATRTPGLAEPDADAELLAEIDHYLEATPTSTGLVDWRSTDTFDRMADLGELSVPALILCGEADPLTPPKYAEYMHTHIPTSEIHTLEGAYHMFPMERAGTVAGLVRRFAARL